jgi:hypothetical protein
MLAEAGSRALGALRNKLYNLKSILIGSYSTLYNAGVIPILDYCSGVWGFSEFKCLEDIQLKAARYFLGVHKFCPIPAIEGDIGWVKCSTRRKLDIVKLWNKIVMLNDQRLPRRILNYDVNKRNANSNWSSDLVCLLHSLQMHSNLEFFELIDVDTFTQKLQTKQLSNWNDQRSQKIKLRNYNLFKSDMSAEPYVLMNLPKNIRSYYAQFRMGILPIMIEVGRYHGIPLEQRFCPLCTEIQCEIIEDEFHLLCICQSYENLRLQLYNKVIKTFPLFMNLDNFEKFLMLNTNFQLETAKFVNNVMKIRQNYLYRI